MNLGEGRDFRRGTSEEGEDDRPRGSGYRNEDPHGRDRNGCGQRDRRGDHLSDDVGRRAKRAVGVREIAVCVRVCDLDGAAKHHQGKAEQTEEESPGGLAMRF